MPLPRTVTGPRILDADESDATPAGHGYFSDDPGLRREHERRLAGHADAGFTFKVYARDGRDEAAVIADVLGRATGVGVGN